MRAFDANLASRLQLHVLTDRTCSRGRDMLTVARQALAGGATVIQLRDKTASTSLLYEEGKALRTLTHEYGALLIINDRVDVTLAVGADGVHIGQDDDLPISLARQLLGQERILGISAGNSAEAASAIAAGADYLGVGPIFVTQRKADAGLPIGTALLNNLATRYTIPLVGIGGITSENAGSVIQAGATGVAVITSVVNAEDIQAAASHLARVIRSQRP